jgi:hypothetical protein
MTHRRILAAPPATLSVLCAHFASLESYLDSTIRELSPVLSVFYSPASLLEKDSDRSLPLIIAPASYRYRCRNPLQTLKLQSLHFFLVVFCKSVSCPHLLRDIIAAARSVAIITSSHSSPLFHSARTSARNLTGGAKLSLLPY